jgi:uncharacterized tellurite resistance protein B-like protein
MTDRTGDIRHLHKVATDEFCRRYETGLRAAPDRPFYADCAVGSVQTVGLLRGQGLDRAVVEVRWSGTRFLTRAGKLERSGHDAVAQSLFVLVRKSGVSSDLGRAISSAHCPNCGAPEASATSNACEFCGQVLNDPGRMWVLADILVATSPEGRALLLEIDQARARGSPRSVMPARQPASAGGNGNGAIGGRGALAWMISVMLADGQIDARERRALDRIAADHHVDAEELETMMHAAMQGQLQSPQAASSDEARAWLRGMIQIALADGKIHREESRLLRMMAGRVGLNEYDVRQMIKREWSETYTAARRQLRKVR